MQLHRVFYVFQILTFAVSVFFNKRRMRKRRKDDAHSYEEFFRKRVAQGLADADDDQRKTEEN